MKLTPITIDLNDYPLKLWPILKGAKLYDSSSSPQARVVFIDKDGGYYLKTAAKGTLKAEAQMTRFFADKKLSANVLEYISDDSDWLVTEKIKGEDCTFGAYLSKPEKLCDTIAELLRQLHFVDFTDCPVKNRNETYFNTLEKNYKYGMFDSTYLDNSLADLDAHSAYLYYQKYKHLLKNDVLIHGDYCLPNILLDDFRFSGFIDLGGAGVGDRHIDLFWGAWTLNFNLKTDKYRDRFFDAYGREYINDEILRLISVIETFG